MIGIFLIGVISKKAEKKIVNEFFELFKTPWEFYQDDRSYDVVITTGDNISEIKAKLVILYGSEKTKFDSDNRIEIRSQKRKSILAYNDRHFPIYGKVLTFGTIKRPLIKVKGATEAVGMKINGKDRKKTLRIGFDLFQEIYFLLSSGQPLEYSHIPTLEIHISMLRDWILKSGILLIEIPPVPAGYDFTICLTHDVDFVGIRNHRFDHTMFGFIYRALFSSLIDFFKRKASWNKVLKNWKAVLLLPGVYLGIVEDFWINFEQYMQIENDLPSTFFFLPNKEWSGIGESGKAAKLRAAKYDVTDLKMHIQGLKAQDCEIGLHGIDAWQDSEKGREELSRISSITESHDIGVRMHWLYFNSHSPEILDKAGFLYDATLGYNDDVGYRGGTTQIFRPLGVDKLLELPLHIQDTALFYPGRMALGEDQGFDLCKRLIKNVSIYGGVLVINWHHRSLTPERLWADFYIRLLDYLKEHRVWFGTCGQVVRWFQKRREARFENIEFTAKGLKLKLSGPESFSEPGLSLRVYNGRLGKVHGDDLSVMTNDFIEIPCEVNIEKEVGL